MVIGFCTKEDMEVSTSLILIGVAEFCVEVHVACFPEVQGPSVPTGCSVFLMTFRSNDTVGCFVFICLNKLPLAPPK